MARAPITPRESETASSRFRLPGDSLTSILRSIGRLRSKVPSTKAVPSNVIFHHFDDAEIPKICPSCPFPYEKKGAKPKAAPFSPINCSSGRELERDPQPQPYSAPAIDAFLGETADQSSEIRVRANIIDSINRQQFPRGLIHSDVEITEKCRRAASAAGVCMRTKQRMHQY